MPPLAGHKLLLTSIRKGGTEVFIVDPVTGDMLNVSRSPDGQRICIMSDRESGTNL